MTTRHGRHPDRLVLDPVHGYITIPEPLQPLIDQAVFQRLRRISQTALVSTVYPAANGTRFEHALGTMHLAAYAFDQAWNNSEELRRGIAEQVATDTGLPDRSLEAWATLLRNTVAGIALMHDIGHPPFSHALEEMYLAYREAIFIDADATLGRLNRSLGRQFHEVVGDLLLEQACRPLEDSLRTTLMAVNSAQPNDGTWQGALKNITDGEIDVDRLDYLMRDAKHAGTEYGAIDWRRLLDALEFHLVTGKLRLGPGIRARSAAETLLVQRTQSFKWVYHHQRVVAAELFLRRAVGLLLQLEENSSCHPVGGTQVDLGKLLSAVRPELNYIVPTEWSLARSIGVTSIPHQLAANPVPLVPVDSEEWHRLSPQLFPEIQASVDDGLVVGWLRRAAFLLASTSTAIQRAPHPAEARFLHYFRASLLRKSSFLSAWKRYEEYRDIAIELVERYELKKSVAVAFENVRSRITESLKPKLELMSDSYDIAEPVDLLNRLAALLVRSSDPALPILLDSTQPEPIPGAHGFWEAAYRDFAAAKIAGLCSVLYEGDGRPVPLVATSPLVAALPRVEAERVKLFVYFVRTGTSATYVETTNAKFRKEMRAAFLNAFPVFVRDQLPLAIRETLFLEVDQKGDDDEPYVSA